MYVDIHNSFNKGAKMTTVTKPFVKGFKYPIYPTAEQKVLLEKTFGCCRYVWNKALAEAKQEYEEYLILKTNNSDGDLKAPLITGYSLTAKLPGYKLDKDSLWLSEVNAVSLQQTMLHLGSAYSNTFKTRTGYPKFKKKNNKQSFSLTKNAFRLKEGKLFIAKSKEELIVGYGRNGKDRILPSEPTSCTIVKTSAGMYYISFVCEYIPVKTNGISTIGIDLGLKDFIVSSNGEKVKNPKHLKLFERNLKRKQQQLSSKKKGSKNRNKARIVVARIHERITNLRTNFQHQLSRKLINENQVIGIENLLVKNLVRNRRLSKAISQAAWSSFVNKLLYKAAESQHCNIVKIDTFFPSSHLCNTTKLKLGRRLGLSERSWQCPHCGEVHDRDLNAAANIRDEAIRIIHDYKVPLVGALVLGKTNSY